MTNLKIKDIETLETLSLEELNQVVGGGCPGSDGSFIIQGLNRIPISRMQGQGEVDSQVAVEGEMLFSLIDLINRVQVQN